jgi:hypothetical protein
VNIYGSEFRKRQSYLDIYEWQEKRVTERLKKAEKGGKFLNSDQVDKIVESFKP